LRTFGRLLRNLLWPPPELPAERWLGSLQDPQTGRVVVSGQLTRTGEANTLVILVHGLGGTASSPYLVRAARIAWELGLDTLRLNLRGADAAAGDFYHGGLTAELHAVVSDPAFEGYERIAVLGYSMGGHLALRHAAEAEDPRVGAVAAVCSPLHLQPVSEEFDRASRAPYRYWVLRHLRRCLLDLGRAGVGLPNSYSAIRRARTFREWDSLSVVPRFGFADVDDYYAQASAATVLDRLRVPCLLIASETDPVIPPRAIEEYLPAHAEIGRFPSEIARVSLRRAQEGRPAAFTVLWHRAAGHVAFPDALGLERHLLTWLAAAG
jgi:predicted alpha/beta-fold hydrolase